MNQTLLKQLVHYCKETGSMTWKRRDVSFFKSQRSCDSWNTKYAGKEIITVDGKGYLCGMFFEKRYLLHRMAWLYEYGVFPKIIDHIDGNRKNNALHNLREVTSQQNHMNQRRSSKNTSGVTGVYFNKRKNIWCAQMKFNGKTYHLGSSKFFDEAVKMRKNEEWRLGFSERHGT